MRHDETIRERFGREIRYLVICGLICLCGCFALVIVEELSALRGSPFSFSIRISGNIFALQAAPAWIRWCGVLPYFCFTSFRLARQAMSRWI